MTHSYGYRRKTRKKF